MSKKLLNLQLNHKGQALDNIKQGRDFTRKFYIGKNRNLLWQLFDINFPDKFKFVEKKGSNYNIKLYKGMQVKVHKDGKTYGSTELKQQKLISKDKLLIKQGDEGEIKLANNWSINYFFKEPYKVALSKEYLAMHKEYAKKPKLSHEDKFTRIFIILGLLITVVGVIINQLTYVPPQIESFTEKYQAIQQNTATQVQIPEIPPADQVNEQIEYGKAQTEDVVEKAVEKAEQKTQADLAEAGFDTSDFNGVGNEDISNQLFAVNKIEDIVATGPSNASSDKYTSSNSNNLDNAANSFDFNSTTSGLEGLQNAGAVDLGDNNFKPVEIGTDVGNYTIHSFKNQAEFDAVKDKYLGLKLVKEGNIETEDQSPAEKTEKANITKQVDAFKPQLNKLFRTESLVMNIYGNIEFTIFINEDGTIGDVLIKEASGSSFSDSFLNKAKNIISQWTIRVKDPIGYSFRMQFYKS